MKRPSGRSLRISLKTERPPTPESMIPIAAIRCKNTKNIAIFASAVKDCPVSAVIVCMNRPDKLYPCLQSMLEHNRTAIDVWVVAYMFSAENLASLKRDYPSIHVVESNEIRGFSENNNLAFRQIDSEYIFIVNDDTVQDMPVVDMLLDDFERLPRKAAAVSPKIVFPDGSVQTCGRAPWTAWRWMKHYLHFGDETRTTRWTMQEGLFRTWTLNGACFLARTSAFREAGWFDEAYAFTPEDIALGHRFNDMGLTVYTDADAVITHYAGSTVSAMEQVIKPVRITGSLHFYSRGSRVRRLLLACYAWCIEAARYAKYAILGCRSERDRIMKASARNTMKAVFSGKTAKQIFIEGLESYSGSCPITSK